MADWALGGGLAISLALNALAAGAGVAFVRRKGGWRYLKSKLVAKGLVRDEKLELDVAAYHKTRIELFDRCPVGPDDLVFLGDSITANAPWEEFFPGLAIKNRGIAGDTVAGVLRRVDQVLKPAPRAILLLLGVNDVTNGVPMAQLQADYRMLIARMREQAPTTPLLIQGLLPIDPFRWGARSEGGVPVLNAYLGELARELGADYLDLRPLFEREGRFDPALTYDGLHPNALGYERWRSAIADRVAALAARPPAEPDAAP